MEHHANSILINCHNWGCMRYEHVAKESNFFAKRHPKQPVNSAVVSNAKIIKKYARRMQRTLKC